MAKGSYYAHPTTDVRPAPSADVAEKNKEIYNPNIWPSEEDCPGYRDGKLAASSWRSPTQRKET